MGKGDISVNFVTMWAVLLILFVTIEIATPTSLISIWFALGAVGALISASIAPELIWLQVTLFLLTSGITLCFTRPLVKKHLMVSETATNANRVLEMIGVVREDICNLNGTGTVYVGGKLWTARSEKSTPITTDTQVDILRIEGVKLIVRPHEACT